MKILDGFSTVKGSRLGLRNRMLLKRTGAALLDHGWRSTDSLTIQMDSLHRSFILAVSILFFFSILFGIPAASTVVDPPTVSSLPTNQTFASGRSFYHRPPPTNQLVLPLATIPIQKCHSETDLLLATIIMKFLFIENYSFNQSKRINEYHNQQNK